MTGAIRFDGEVAVVTGAGGGLGRAYALALADRGAAVLCNDLVADAAASTAAAIGERGGRAVAEASSVATPEGGAAIVDAALDAFGAIDVLVNNAGQLRNAPFAEAEPDEVDALIATHLGGAFHVTRPAFRRMAVAGHGRIVFTSSSAVFGSPWQAGYAAAKAGIIGLGHTVALEGEAHGIAANTVLPMALTGIAEDGPPPFPPDLMRETVAALAPLAPEMTVDNVTPLVLYLASRGCTLTRRTFSVGCGHVAEVLLGVTEGWYADGDGPLSPEGVAEHLDEICDPTGFAVPGSMLDGARLIARDRPDPARGRRDR
ncbi:SDR family NAD(P)-dependent oxidoreductase [Dermatobacter hominis]|uniref:SDR family NAD(P)-dependent oxidoreductase n=1 Tax=Dermatobacter hominis TaxID=2884263 RepID=UPI001D106CE8|nr:SDR family NAD(P)-dependent oxidoreductase [Dermatobacter hominis]UDY35083.1 SDR family NAD(P)-dependent oxidoreductase [Dermatobacter hominis]